MKEKLEKLEQLEKEMKEKQEKLEQSEKEMKEKLEKLGQLEKNMEEKQKDKLENKINDQIEITTINVKNNTRFKWKQPTQKTKKLVQENLIDGFTESELDEYLNSFYQNNISLSLQIELAIKKLFNLRMRKAIENLNFQFAKQQEEEKRRFISELESCKKQKITTNNIDKQQKESYIYWRRIYL